MKLIEETHQGHLLMERELPQKKIKNHYQNKKKGWKQIQSIGII